MLGWLVLSLISPLGLVLIIAGLLLRSATLALLGCSIAIVSLVSLLAPAGLKQKVLLWLKTMHKRGRMELDRKAKFVNEVLDMLALSSGVTREDVEAFLSVLRRADSVMHVRFRARGIEIDFDRGFWDGALLLTIKRKGPAGEESISIDITTPWYLERPKKAEEERWLGY